MAIKTVSNSQLWTDIQSTMQDFRNGKTNLTKDALTKLKTDLATLGGSTTDIEQLITNYDKVDLNGDGMSVAEYKTYAPKNLKGDFDDKSFSKAELKALYQKIDGGSGTKALGLAQLIDKFTDVDADGDGSVTMEEMNRYAAKNHFALVDGSSTLATPQSLRIKTNSLYLSATAEDDAAPSDSVLGMLGGDENESDIGGSLISMLRKNVGE